MKGEPRRVAEFRVKGLKSSILEGIESSGDSRTDVEEHSSHESD